MAVRPGINKTVIMQAAVEMASEMGLEQVSLALLAKKLNIQTPSLYNHIEGMPGLRKDLAYWGLSLIKEKLANAAIGVSGEKALMAMGLAYLTFARQHRGLYEATLRAPDNDDLRILNIAEDVVNLLLCVMEVYALSKEDALHAVRGLRSIFHGFVTLEMKNGFGLPLDRDDSYSFIIKTYLSGLKNPQA